LDATRIGIIACRVGAAVLTVKAISGLGNIIPALFFDSPSKLSAVTIGFMVVTVIPGLSAILLWVYAERICQVPSLEGGASDHLSQGSDELIQIGTALLGLYLMVTGLISAASIEIAYLARPETDESTMRSSMDYAARILGWRVAYVLEVVFGAVLFLGKERVVELLNRVRRVGTGAP